MEPVVCSWSGGKESALALHAVRTESRLEVAELLTMTAPGPGRTSYHGVRTELIERQAAALDLPVSFVPIARNCTGEQYVDLMAEVFEDFRDRGIERLILGDVFLEDPTDYRERAMADTSFRSYCPLLGEPTDELIERFLAAGFEARTVCVEDDLAPSFLGRRLDRSFLQELPADVDPCGEDGEYHTFVTDGPGFAEPVAVRTGERRRSDVGETTMVYRDLLPDDEES